MKAFLLTHTFGLISGPIIGVLVYFGHEQLQKAWTRLDNQSPTVKRVVAFVLSAALTPLAAMLGVALPASCSGADMDAVACVAGLADKGWLTAAVGGAVALAIHAVVKPKKPAS